MADFPGYLTEAEIADLQDALVQAGVATLSAQDALVAALLPAYAMGLPYPNVPLQRLGTHIRLMNRVSNLRNGDVPLAQFLGAAMGLAGGHPKTDIIESALAKVNGARTGNTRDATAVLIGGNANLNVQEAYATGIDGTLDVGFLRGGMHAAQSVVKLIVHRHVNGQPEFEAGDLPRVVSGTGWIIGKGMVITNHHVINARQNLAGVSEADASDGDFVMQAENTTILYDYLDKSPDPPGHRTGAGALLCADKVRDFAVIKVPAGAPDRPKLRLRQHPIRKTLQQALGTRVNILQHPNGNPMRLAFRDNFVVLGDDQTLSYLTDTSLGSSGSPVCDDSWTVAALHSGSRPIADQNIVIRGNKIRRENHGIPIVAILAKLKADHPAVYAEI
jgi:V8-like Glu-specific endopeptidase